MGCGTGMKNYVFSFVYQLDDRDDDHDAIVERFGEASLTDFMIGIGRAGFLGLELEREGRSADAVLRKAIGDVATMVPGARLVEVGPDFAGLTDIAESVGVSRQNMRKLMVGNDTFPLPVHGGSSSIWHAAEVLCWLRDEAGYEIGQGEIAAAHAAWRVNAELEAARLRRAGCVEN
jgi:predicted DNA-binding transcriptional regulator AlpA